MDPPDNSYVANCIINQLQEDFRGQEVNVRQPGLEPHQCRIIYLFYFLKFHLTSTHLARGEAGVPKNGPKMTGLKSFLMRSQDPKPNFLLIIDTHSCYKTGYLKHGMGANKEAWVAPIDKVSKC
jgi:hypothetical protein